MSIDDAVPRRAGRSRGRWSTWRRLASLRLQRGRHRSASRSSRGTRAHFCARRDSTTTPQSEKMSPRAAAAKAREQMIAMKDDLISPGKKRALPERPDGWGGFSKRKRCGECDGCNATDCGRCDNCRDMPKYGGRGTKRQSCRMRMCHVIAEEDSKMKVERDAVREKERAEREEKRAAERAEREANRPARKSGGRSSGSRSGGASRARRIARRAAAGAVGRAWSARLPAVRLEQCRRLGKETMPRLGVEARLIVEPGMEDARYSTVTVVTARRGRRRLGERTRRRNKGQRAKGLGLPASLTSSLKAARRTTGGRC